MPRPVLLAGLAVLAASAMDATPARADLFDFLGIRNQRDSVKRTPRFANIPSRVKEPEIKEPVPDGQMFAIVSIAQQNVRIYADGKLHTTEPVSTGTPSNPTPTGVFSVIGKARHHISNLYDAPMPYMHRITWSGVALHAGVLPGRPASHGCIRLNEKFASRLFDISKIGLRVIVTRDPAEPVEISHARLFVPKKPDEEKKPEKSEDVPAAAAPGDAIKNEPVRTAELKTADVTGTLPIIAPEPATVKPSTIIETAQKKWRGRAAAPLRKGPVQVFVSRKQAKLFVRVGFAPVFEAPVKIAEPDKPWGTHIFTAMDLKDGGTAMRWTAVTIPSGYLPQVDEKRPRKLTPAQQQQIDKLAADLSNAPAAAEALDRFEIPADALERITALLAPGSALTVSDNPLSHETGLETDFVVLTNK